MYLFGSKRARDNNQISIKMNYKATAVVLNYFSNKSPYKTNPLNSEIIPRVQLC